MNNRYYYLLPIIAVVKFFLLLVLFDYMNFDSSLNLDYLNYQVNYEYEWRQHEAGFEFLSDVARLINLQFEDFWFVILIFQVLLLAILYRNHLVFLLAFPNLVYLSQGLLGTQVRFGLAVTFFLVLYSFLKRRRYFLLVGLLPLAFHNAIVIFYMIYAYMKFFIKVSHDLSKNLKSLLGYSAALLFVVLFIDFLLIAMGYDYYVGTKYQQGRSLAGLLYLFTHFFLLTILLSLKNENSSFEAADSVKDWVFFAYLIIIFALIFMNSSIISGRLTLVYTLLEPFILYWILLAFKDKVLKLTLFIIFMVVSYTKLLILGLN
ncbi:MAG: EpsG family protein [Pseudoalteromonas prydzensis]|uniref:EpsG family protein n=1 Tax=Pseudoalteromonas prydzensis TaxID=182141 RepID=UPI003F9A6886